MIETQQTGTAMLLQSSHKMYSTHWIHIITRYLYIYVNMATKMTKQVKKKTKNTHSYANFKDKNIRAGTTNIY